MTPAHPGDHSGQECQAAVPPSGPASWRPRARGCAGDRMGTGHGLPLGPPGGRQTVAHLVAMMVQERETRQGVHTKTLCEGSPRHLDRPQAGPRHTHHWLSKRLTRNWPSVPRMSVPCVSTTGACRDHGHRGPASSRLPAVGMVFLQSRERRADTLPVQEVEPVPQTP